MPELMTKAVILAGGSARRMGGGDKPLLVLSNRPILVWILERIQPQVGSLAISANGDPERLKDYGCEILPDQTPDLGPMSGILAALNWARQSSPTATHVLTVSGDTPFLPSDLMSRLGSAITEHGAPMATAASDGHLHPTASLWPITALALISKRLQIGEGQRVTDWLRMLNSQTVEWNTSPVDPFFNINTPDDLQEAEKLVKLIL